MLKPEYYDVLTDDLIRLYSDLDNVIITDITRRILKTGRMTESAKWQAKQLQESGLLYDDILADIAKRTDATENHVRTLFEDAGVESVKIDNQSYRKAGLSGIIKLSPAAMQVLNAGFVKCNGNLKNLTLTTAVTSQQAYITACNNAYMQVTSGAFDYNTAIRNAIKSVAVEGTHVLYPTGHRDRIDVAVRRAVLTGVGQTVRKLSVINAEDMDCDIMEITAHSGARPSHAVWQGQLVSLSGRNAGKIIEGCRVLSLKDIGYGSGDGFGGWNCRHDWYPFFVGISKRAYSDERLKELDAKNIEYNGRKYSEYEISQIQRKYEREIRSAKREQVAFKTAVQEAQDPELKAVMQDSLNYANSLVRDKQAKMRDFINQTGQFRDYSREQNCGRVNYPKNSFKNDKKYIDKYFWSGIINNGKKNSLLATNSDSIPETIHNKVNSAIQRIAKKFPVINEQISIIKYGNLVNAYGQCDFNTGTAINEITLLKSLFSDENRLIQALRNDFETKKSYETNSPESLVAHEIGHALHSILALKRTGLQYGKRMTSFEAIAFNNERTKIVQEIYCLYFTDESYIEIAEECKRQLGTMAENPNELIAQAFGNYYYGLERQPLATAIVKYFRKELK